MRVNTADNSDKNKMSNAMNGVKLGEQKQGQERKENEKNANGGEKKTNAKIKGPR